MRFDHLDLEHTPWENFKRLPRGMMLLLKCNKHTENTSTSNIACKLAGTIIIPVCTNTGCSHPPIDHTNNCYPAERWAEAFRARLALSYLTDLTVSDDDWLKLVCPNILLATTS
jgi:hypothetical protein